MEVRLRRLPVSGVQRQYGLLAYGCARAIALGETSHDDTELRFTRDSSDCRRSRHQYLVALFHQRLFRGPALNRLHRTAPLAAAGHELVEIDVDYRCDVERQQLGHNETAH